MSFIFPSSISSKQKPLSPHSSKPLPSKQPLYYHTPLSSRRSLYTDEYVQCKIINIMILKLCQIYNLCLVIIIFDSCPCKVTILIFDLSRISLLNCSIIFCIKLNTGNHNITIFILCPQLIIKHLEIIRCFLHLPKYQHYHGFL